MFLTKAGTDFVGLVVFGRLDVAAEAANAAAATAAAGAARGVTS